MEMSLCCLLLLCILPSRHKVRAEPALQVLGRTVRLPAPKRSVMPPSLRTRQSTADQRVTLFSLDSPAASTSTHDVPSVERGSASRSNGKSSRAHEPEDATPKKRVRKTAKSAIKAEEDGDGDEDVKKSSPSPRKSSPTKIRAKLLKAHPAPPRWQETYDIVSRLEWPYICPPTES